MFCRFLRYPHTPSDGSKRWYMDDWIFLLINLNDDYDGASNKASNKLSDVVQFRTMESLDGQLVISGPWLDLITAILSHRVSLMSICGLNC